ncbi:hypothetical protein ACPV5G_20875 [Photobacterium damselae]|uniref:hypothetical protein n=1 Tax=Photobacterium damselae TaxID=38293 RepID=UPI00406799C0
MSAPSLVNQNLKVKSIIYVVEVTLQQLEYKNTFIVNVNAKRTKEEILQEVIIKLYLMHSNEDACAEFDLENAKGEKLSVEISSYSKLVEIATRIQIIALNNLTANSINMTEGAVIK